MASLNDFRKVADQVRNWGRRDAEDEFGAVLWADGGRTAATDARELLDTTAEAGR